MPSTAKEVSLLSAHEDDVEQDGLQRIVAHKAREILVIHDARVDCKEHYETAPPHALVQNMSGRAPLGWLSDTSSLTTTT